MVRIGRDHKGIICSFLKIVENIVRSGLLDDEGVYGYGHESEH